MNSQPCKSECHRYLFTTLPSNDLGLLTRSLPIAGKLRNRGHHVSFCSPAKAPRKLIADAGFNNLIPAYPPYYLISGDIFSSESMFRLMRSRHIKRDLKIIFSFLKLQSQSSTAEIRDIDHFMYLFGMGDENGVRANVDAMIETIQTDKPDVMVDFWNPFACIAARSCDIPLITVIQADMHPASQGFIWWKDPLPEVFPSPISATNSILAEHHLPPVKKMGELLTGDTTLVAGIPETDPLPSGCDVTYLGPLLWEKPEEKLPDRISRLSREQPVIWLYPGNLRYLKGSRTFGDSEIILRACIEALGNEAVQVVLSTGHHVLPSRFNPLPPNFFHEPYIPGMTMAKRSDLLIHHGGYGSCQTGLYTGRPALIIPTYSERESNARRVAAQGAGDYVLPISDVTGRKKQVSSGEVRAKVFRILSERSYAENAQRISEKMMTYGGASAAADLIECHVHRQSGKAG